jgi:hypothetical protein
MQRYPHRVDAQGLERAVEADLEPLDRDAGSRERLGDVAGIDRAIQLTGLTGLTQHRDAAAVDLRSRRGGVLLALQVGGLELDPAPLELRQIASGGAQRLALRHQIVAREAVFDGDHVAHLTELLDPLEQDHLHADSLRELSQTAPQMRPILDEPQQQHRQDRPPEQHQRGIDRRQ